MTLANDTQPGTLLSSGAACGCRALILMSGSVRPTPLTQAIGRSLLDMPVEAGKSVLDLWARQAAELAQSLGMDQFPVRVLVDRASPEPRLPALPGDKEVNGDRVGSRSSGVRFQIERDPGELRGTGGLLRDVAAGYAGEDRLLVSGGAEILTEPLADLAAAMTAVGGDVALLAHQDGTPASLKLVRCGCLGRIAEIGFVDMKEQALPLIARQHTIKVVQRGRLASYLIRTLSDYIAALRWYHRAKDSRVGADAFAEDWRPVFSIVEDGASVDKTACVHDAVVLAGARVERGAVVARSVVCPGAVVARGQVVVEKVVGRNR